MQKTTFAFDANIARIGHSRTNHPDPHARVPKNIGGNILCARPRLPPATPGKDQPNTPRPAWRKLATPCRPDPLEPGPERRPTWLRQTRQEVREPR